MFPSVEMRHLHAAIILAEELSFTKAASRLNITQPALSKQITDLEEHRREIIATFLRTLLGYAGTLV